MTTIPCPCPALPGGEPRHDSDELTLKPRLGFVESSAVRNAVTLRRSEAGEDIEASEIMAVLTEGYIVHGTASWTLEDAEGKPLPVTRANIRAYILDRWDIASVVADDADDQYAEAVMLPLLNKASTSSRPSQTPDSTSANPASGTPAPTPSKRSSISTIPTADTGTTTSSRDGASSSSQSSTSAA